MTPGRRCGAAALLVLLVQAAPLVAQDSLLQARSALGLRAGVSFTPGEWSKSRVEPSLALYGSGMTFEGDLEFRIAARWTLAVGGGYAALNGSAWEDYVRATGDQLTVSAWEAHAEILLRPHIFLGADDIVRLELGPAAIFAGGGERYAGREYSYDELPEYAFGGMLGLEYVHLFGRTFALTLRATCMLFPGALTYVDGVDRTIILLPVTSGIRLFF